MAGGFALLAGIVLYLLLVRTFDSGKMTPLGAAVILIIGYYTLASFVMGLELSARDDIPLLANLFSVERIVTALVQFAVAVGIFYKVDDSSDEYIPYMLWGGLGLALIFFVVPPVVQSLVISFY